MFVPFSTYSQRGGVKTGALKFFRFVIRPGDILKRYERRIEEKNYFITVIKIITDIAVVLGAALFLFTYLGDTAVMTGYSMEKTLTNNDVVLVDKLTYRLSKIKRFDIVVFDVGDGRGEYIKRVIGMPGEKVLIKNGKIYIDGDVLEEPFESDPILMAGTAEKTVILGDDEYFVLGDNRNNSEDSRFETIGNVKRDNIIGRAWFEITSLNDFGLIK